jgi:hypothetical protein
MSAADAGVPIREAADALGISQAAVRQRILRGTLTSYRVAGRVHVVLPDDFPTNGESSDGLSDRDTVSSGVSHDHEAISSAVAALTEQLAVKDEQLAEKDTQIATLHQQLADRSREVSELHVMLQTAQRLIPASVSQDAPETRSETSGATNHAEPAANVSETLAASERVSQARSQAEPAPAKRWKFWRSGDGRV